LRLRCTRLHTHALRWFTFHGCYLRLRSFGSRFTVTVVYVYVGYHVYVYHGCLPDCSYGYAHGWLRWFRSTFAVTVLRGCLRLRYVYVRFARALRLRWLLLLVCWLRLRSGCTHAVTRLRLRFTRFARYRAFGYCGCPRLFYAFAFGYGYVLLRLHALPFTVGSSAFCSCTRFTVYRLRVTVAFYTRTHTVAFTFTRYGLLRYHTVVTFHTRVHYTRTFATYVYRLALRWLRWVQFGYVGLRLVHVCGLRLVYAHRLHVWLHTRLFSCVYIFTVYYGYRLLHVPVYAVTVTFGYHVYCTATFAVVPRCLPFTFCTVTRLRYAVTGYTTPRTQFTHTARSVPGWLVYHVTFGSVVYARLPFTVGYTRLRLLRLLRLHGWLHIRWLLRLRLRHYGYAVRLRLVLHVYVVAFPYVCCALCTHAHTTALRYRFTFTVPTALRTRFTHTPHVLVTHGWLPVYTVCVYVTLLVVLVGYTRSFRLHFTVHTHGSHVTVTHVCYVLRIFLRLLLRCAFTRCFALRSRLRYDTRLRLVTAFVTHTAFTVTHVYRTFGYVRLRSRCFTHTPHRTHGWLRLRMRLHCARLPFTVAVTVCYVHGCSVLRVAVYAHAHTFTRLLRYGCYLRLRFTRLRFATGYGYLRLPLPLLPLHRCWLRLRYLRLRVPGYVAVGYVYAFSGFGYRFVYRFYTHTHAVHGYVGLVLYVWLLRTHAHARTLHAFACSLLRLRCARLVTHVALPLPFARCRLRLRLHHAFVPFAVTVTFTHVPVTVYTFVYLPRARVQFVTLPLHTARFTVRLPHVSTFGLRWLRFVPVYGCGSTLHYTFTFVYGLRYRGCYTRLHCTRLVRLPVGCTPHTPRVPHTVRLHCAVRVYLYTVLRLFHGYTVDLRCGSGYLYAVTVTARSLPVTPRFVVALHTGYAFVYGWVTLLRLRLLPLRAARCGCRLLHTVTHVTHVRYTFTRLVTVVWLRFVTAVTAHVGYTVYTRCYCVHTYTDGYVLRLFRFRIYVTVYTFTLPFTFTHFARFTFAAHHRLFYHTFGRYGLRFHVPVTCGYTQFVTLFYVWFVRFRSFVGYVYRTFTCYVTCLRYGLRLPHVCCGSVTTVYLRLRLVTLDYPPVTRLRWLPVVTGLRTPLHTTFPVVYVCSHARFALRLRWLRLVYARCTYTHTTRLHTAHRYGYGLVVHRLRCVHVWFCLYVTRSRLRLRFWFTRARLHTVRYDFVLRWFTLRLRYVIAITTLHVCWFTGSHGCRYWLRLVTVGLHVHTLGYVYGYGSVYGYVGYTWFGYGLRFTFTRSRFVTHVMPFTCVTHVYVHGYHTRCYRWFTFTVCSLTVYVYGCRTYRLARTVAGCVYVRLHTPHARLRTVCSRFGCGYTAFGSRWFCGYGSCRSVYRLRLGYTVIYTRYVYVHTLPVG